MSARVTGIIAVSQACLQQRRPKSFDARFEQAGLQCAGWAYFDAFGTANAFTQEIIFTRARWSNEKGVVAASLRRGTKQGNRCYGGGGTADELAAGYTDGGRRTNDEGIGWFFILLFGQSKVDCDGRCGAGGCAVHAHDAFGWLDAEPGFANGDGTGGTCANTRGAMFAIGDGARLQKGKPGLKRVDCAERAKIATPES